MLDKIRKKQKSIKELKRELELTGTKIQTIRKEANHKRVDHEIKEYFKI